MKEVIAGLIVFIVGLGCLSTIITQRARQRSMNARPKLLRNDAVIESFYWIMAAAIGLFFMIMGGYIVINNLMHR